MMLVDHLLDKIPLHEYPKLIPIMSQKIKVKMIDYYLHHTIIVDQTYYDLCNPTLLFTGQYGLKDIKYYKSPIDKPLYFNLEHRPSTCGIPGCSYCHNQLLASIGWFETNPTTILLPNWFWLLKGYKVTFEVIDYTLKFLIDDRIIYQTTLENKISPTTGNIHYNPLQIKLSQLPRLD